MATKQAIQFVTTDNFTSKTTAITVMCGEEIRTFSVPHYNVEKCVEKMRAVTADFTELSPAIVSILEAIHNYYRDQYRAQ